MVGGYYTVGEQGPELFVPVDNAVRYVLLGEDTEDEQDPEQPAD